MMLEMGRVPIGGEGREQLMRRAAAELMAEAGLDQFNA